MLTLSGTKRMRLEDVVETKPLPSMVTAFGEHKVAEQTPLIQETFPYTGTLNPRKFATSGSVTTAAGLLSLSGAAQAETLRRCKYRAGQGLVARFTALFPAAHNAANSALIGLGDDNNGFFIVQDQTQSNRLRILHRNATVDTYIDQKDWNLNTCLGGDDNMDRKDWSKGNIFQIQLQYLGFGAIVFSVERQSDGVLVPVHRIQYAGKNTVPSLSNASLPFRLKTTGAGGQVRTASVGVFVEGPIRQLGLSFARTNVLAVTTTEQNVLTIRNKSTIGALPNNDLLYPLLLTATAVAGTKPVVLRVLTQTTFGSAPTYANHDAAASNTEYSTSVVAVSGGSAVAACVVSATGSASASLDLSKLNIGIGPGEVLCVAASTTSGTADVHLSLSWFEDV